MIQVAICDDMKSDLERIQEIIKYQEQKIFGHSISEIHIYSGGTELLSDSPENFDVIIMDVMLGDMNGKDIAAAIRDKNPNFILCIISRDCGPLPNDFSIAPYRYIMKDDEDLALKSLEDVMKEAYKRKHLNYLFCHMEDKIVRFQLHQILYISKLKYGSEIHFSKNTFKVKEHLKDMEQKLLLNGFAYPHNSYMVNYEKIISFHENCKLIELENHTILGISRGNKERFLNGHLLFQGR